MFSKARGTKKNRERKGPARGIIQKCAPRERSLYAPKFEERSQDETLHQERCVRRVAWDLAKNVCKLKNSDKSSFYFPIEARATPAPTSKSSEEREFEVDSGASMHMLSRKDLRSGKLDTLRKSRNPTTVVTANGEVQTNKEAHVYVYDPDLFVTVQILEDTPAVVSLGKLCGEHGYTCEVCQRSKATPDQTREEDPPKSKKEG